jgi:hypothetical protein
MIDMDACCNLSSRAVLRNSHEFAEIVERAYSIYLRANYTLGMLFPTFLLSWIYNIYSISTLLIVYSISLEENRLITMEMNWSSVRPSNVLLVVL